MKHTVTERTALKAKSEELGIPFSNLLAGYVLETLMYLIEDSPFSLFLWLKNDTALGVGQYRKGNILTLEFAYITDPLVVKRGDAAPGQVLSLKMGYVMLAYILKAEKTPEIKWKGRASMKGEMVELEISGEFDEMTVPIRIRVAELIWTGMVPERRTFPLFMENGKQIPYLQYPAEIVLAEQMFEIMKNMELLPEMGAYDMVYAILCTEAVDGRHIRQMLSDACEWEGIVPDKERGDVILSYRSYTYMRKRWEKYLRHQKRTEPSWESVMEVLDGFLPRIWRSICEDEVFFGDWMPGLGRFLD